MGASKAVQKGGRVLFFSGPQSDNEGAKALLGARLSAAVETRLWVSAERRRTSGLWYSGGARGGGALLLVGGRPKEKDQRSEEGAHSAGRKNKRTAGAGGGAPTISGRFLVLGAGRALQN